MQFGWFVKNPDLGRTRLLDLWNSAFVGSVTWPRVVESQVSAAFVEPCHAGKTDSRNYNVCLGSIKPNVTYMDDDVEARLPVLPLSSSSVITFLPLSFSSINDLLLFFFLSKHAWKINHIIFLKVTCIDIFCRRIY